MATLNLWLFCQIVLKKTYKPFSLKFNIHLNSEKLDNMEYKIEENLKFGMEARKNMYSLRNRIVPVQYVW